MQAGEYGIDFLDRVSPLLEEIGVDNYNLAFVDNKASITFSCQDVNIMDKWNDSFLKLSELASKISFRIVKKIKDCMVAELWFPVEIRHE